METILLTQLLKPRNNKDVGLSQRCECGEVCQLGARPPRQRLSELLNSALRFCMRRIFNKPDVVLAANSGSYRYNDDDVAAVAHVALVLVETRLNSVESMVLGLKASAGATSENDELARVGEFVEAHKFLSALFPNEQAQRAMEVGFFLLEKFFVTCTIDMKKTNIPQDSDREAWSRMRRYVALAREVRNAGCKFEDELLFGEWFKIIDKLKEHSKLAAAAAVVLDGGDFFALFFSNQPTNKLEKKKTDCWVFFFCRRRKSPSQNGQQ